MTQAVIWHWDSADVYVVSVQPPHEYEHDLGHFKRAHDAVGHLNHWADQRGLVVIPTDPWLDGAVNRFNFRPLPANGRSEP